MIATLRGLAIAGAVAVALVVATVVDLARTPAPVDRVLVPGFDPATVTALRWTGDRTVELARGADARWQWRGDGAPVERATLDAILAALRGARWHRRTDGRGATTTQLAITVGARTLQLGIAAPLPGSAQTWIERDGARYLVDDWVVRALTPSPLALRIRQPLADASAARRIVLERASPPAAYRLEGAPRQLVKPQALLLAPEVADEVERALAALELVALAPPSTAPASWTLTIDAPLLTTVELRGACADPAQVAITGTVGAGCVARAAVQRLEAAVARLDDPRRAADPRPLPLAATQLTLADGAVLDVTKRPRVGDRDADPVKVTELLAVLGTPGEPAPRPAGDGRRVVTARDASGRELALYELGGGLYARGDEAFAVRLGAGAAAILARGGAAFVEPTLWTEEPRAITAITVDGTRYTRGAVVGEWSASADLLEPLVTALAAPRSLRTLRGASRQRRAIELTITPPTGPAYTRRFQLAGPGCVLIVDGANHAIAPEACALAARL